MLSPIALNGLAGLTLWRTRDGRWQASTTRDRVSWRVAIRDDPGEAVAAVLTGADQAPQATQESVFD